MIGHHPEIFPLIRTVFRIAAATSGWFMLPRRVHQYRATARRRHIPRRVRRDRARVRGLQGMRQPVDREAAIIAVQQAEVVQDALGEPLVEALRVAGNDVPVFLSAFQHFPELRAFANIVVRLPFRSSSKSRLA